LKSYALGMSIMKLFLWVRVEPGPEEVR